MPPVWPYWVDQGTGTFYPATSSANVWNVWITTSATSASVYPQTSVWQGSLNQPITSAMPFGQTVWVNWQTIGTVNVFPTAAPLAPAPPPTPEQLAERARRSLISRNRSHAYSIRRKMAARKAEQLLLEHLSAAQREEWQAERAFTVHTADGKRAYRVAYGLAGNVRLVKADEAPLSKHGRLIPVGARFCMHVYHPDGQVPNEDNVLAQKLLIESNEAHFLELANVS